MKRILLILFILMPIFTMYGQEESMLIKKKSGEIVSIAIDKIDTISFVSNGDVQHNKWYFMLENPGIADYLRDFEYDDNDYSYHKIFDYRGDPYLDDRQDWPYGVELPDTVIYNLIPGRKYSMNIQGKSYSFWTLGQLRMVKLEGVNNVRDLGGWHVENGRLRYGCIVRGPELDTTLPASNPQAKYHKATNSDIETLRSRIGIRAELDLRAAVEAPSDYSVLGKDIQYLNHDRCSPSEITCPDAAWITPLQFIITCLQAELPIYVHCCWGADRTGLLSMLIEGVLGVSESDLAKDYELTSFAGNTRYRTDARFSHSINYIKTLPGETLREKFRSYWRACGATEEELNMLATLMIEYTSDSE